MVKLSILVTFYNQEEYVDRAMNSIFSQKTNFDYEIIIGDDGSSDGTHRKIEEWQEKYPGKIRLVVQPREPGKKYLSGERASNNRLSLLKYITGTYFMYLDGDDCYCDESKFQKQVDILDDPKNADCSCCAHNVSFIRLDGTSSILRTNIKKSGKVDFGYYWWKGYFHPDSLMFRSSSINQKQKVFRNPLFNDNYITFVFSHSGKIYFLSDVMASYYETDNGIWNGQSRTVGLMRTLIIYEYISYVYGKYKQSNYFRFIPLYYMLLRNSNEFSEERLSPYFQMATECHAEKIAQLKDADKGKLAVKRSFIGIIYRVNAAIKRIV